MEETMKIPVCEIEFEEGGKAIWVHAPDGTTPLRIQCEGAIVVHALSNVQHMSIDLRVANNIHVMARAVPLDECGLEKMERELEEAGWLRRACGMWEDPQAAVSHLPTTQAHAVFTARSKPSHE